MWRIIYNHFDNVLERTAFGLNYSPSQVHKSYVDNHSRRRKQKQNWNKRSNVSQGSLHNNPLSRGEASNIIHQRYSRGGQPKIQAQSTAWTRIAPRTAWNRTNDNKNSRSIPICRNGRERSIKPFAWSDDCCCPVMRSTIRPKDSLFAWFSRRRTPPFRRHGLSAGIWPIRTPTPIPRAQRRGLPNPSANPFGRSARKFRDELGPCSWSLPLPPGALPAVLLTTTTALRTEVWSSNTGLARRANTHETQASLQTTATRRCYGVTSSVLRGIQRKRKQRAR